jgi:tetratricopeptide (TPR) repeat protein
MAVWGKSPRLLETKKDRILFLDTETSGLAGGTGTYAFLVGVGWYSETGFTVAQYFMRDPLEEPALLAAISERLAGFDVIVTFNGKSFDIPLLNTRLTLNRFPLPFGEMDHIDLLHLARRLWRNRLASRAMGDLEKDIIGFIRDQDEVPGYLIPQYYFDYLSSGDARPLAGVFYHNVFDIVSLAVLFDYMANVLDSPSDFNLHSLDVVAVARLYEENGRIEDAAELYEQGLSSGLPEEIFFTTIDRFATLRRRQGQFQHAATLWEKSARMGNLSACRELSKLLEHNLKRPSDAIAWAQAGLDVCQKSRLPRYQAQLWHEEFTKRIERLRKKVDYG